MSRKSSWWLRPHRKGASNRAALNEAKYFMELNKVLAAENAKLRELNKELAAENAKLRELVADMWRGSVVRMDFAERYAFIGEFVDRMREL